MYFTTHEATELHLYASNDSRCYESYLLPALQNLERKWRKDTFIYDLGLRLLSRYTLVAIAKQYRREHGGITDNWNRLFPVAARQEVAETLLDSFVTEMRCGNTYLTPRKASGSYRAGARPASATAPKA